MSAGSLGMTVRQRLIDLDECRPECLDRAGLGGPVPDLICPPEASENWLLRTLYPALAHNEEGHVEPFEAVMLQGDPGETRERLRSFNAGAAAQWAEWLSGRPWMQNASVPCRAGKEHGAQDRADDAPLLSVGKTYADSIRGPLHAPPGGSNA